MRKETDKESAKTIKHEVVVNWNSKEAAAQKSGNFSTEESVSQSAVILTSCGTAFGSMGAQEFAVALSLLAVAAVENWLPG